MFKSEKLTNHGPSSGIVVTFLTQVVAKAQVEARRKKLNEECTVGNGCFHIDP